MVRSIKVSPKSVFFSTCLLLVLVAGVMAQTAAESTNVSLDLSVYNLFSGTAYFQAVVNGKPYCVIGYPDSTSLPLNFTVNKGMEGYCSPLEYVGAGGGGLVTSDYHPSQFSVLGWITIGLQGHTVTVVVDLTAGGTTIQSKFTGNINNWGASGCTFSNVVSQYTSVTGAGLNLSLQPLAYSGTCSVPGAITLDFTFSTPTAAVGPVGGVVIPVNKFAVLAPWLALIGLVGCIGTVFVIAKERRQ
ncbi:MAG: hypothetical protein ABSG74_10915 [Candidatus Bathyarchaeia archaeon]|jgi:hypothetical protein